MFLSFPCKDEEKNIRGLVQAALFSDSADLLESDFMSGESH